jgi:hypothetical protein
LGSEVGFVKNQERSNKPQEGWHSSREKCLVLCQNKNKTKEATAEIVLYD